MITDDLINGVKEMLNAGASEGDVKHLLLERGWSEDETHEVFSIIERDRWIEEKEATRLRVIEEKQREEEERKKKEREKVLKAAHLKEEAEQRRVEELRRAREEAQKKKEEEERRKQEEKEKALAEELRRKKEREEEKRRKEAERKKRKEERRKRREEEARARKEEREREMILQAKLREEEAQQRREREEQRAREEEARKKQEAERKKCEEEQKKQEEDKRALAEAELQRKRGQEEARKKQEQEEQELQEALRREREELAREREHLEQERRKEREAQVALLRVERERLKEERESIKRKASVHLSQETPHNKPGVQERRSPTRGNPLELLSGATAVALKHFIRATIFTSFIGLVYLIVFGSIIASSDVSSLSIPNILSEVRGATFPQAFGAAFKSSLIVYLLLLSISVIVVGAGNILMGRKKHFSRLLSETLKKSLPLSIIFFSLFALMVGGGVLAVIPGIAFGALCSFAPIIFLSRGISPLESLELSIRTILPQFWFVLSRLALLWGVVALSLVPLLFLVSTLQYVEYLNLFWGVLLFLFVSVAVFSWVVLALLLTLSYTFILFKQVARKRVFQKRAPSMRKAVAAAVPISYGVALIGTVLTSL